MFRSRRTQGSPGSDRGISTIRGSERRAPSRTEPSTHRFVELAPRELATSVGTAINCTYLAPESEVLKALAVEAQLSHEATERIQHQAERLVSAVRASRVKPTALDAFLREYHLGSAEGVILMCLAEALLRVPDAATADRLIADKIPGGAWEEHLGTSESILVNASTLGLLLTGRIVEVDRDVAASVRAWLGKLIARLGEPWVRAALRQSMRLLGHQFVMGQGIDEALTRTVGPREDPYRHSFDMLGESAITTEDAERYLAKYEAAIDAIGRRIHANSELIERPSISVKLSALHPRYEPAQRARVLKELLPRLLALLVRARDCGIGLTVDAEESERLELSLLLIDAILVNPVTEGYPAFGLAVQAYQRRAAPVIRWLTARTGELKRRITVRLVKGAYWDTEIKRAQEKGLASYPVFTRKASTDVSYLACARLLFSARQTLYPQFATHNAHTVSYIGELFADEPAAFEYQRLHGMGEALYEEVLRCHRDYRCRIYAPVGPHPDLLPYLVRRLLENGANTSFVNRLTDEALPVAAIVADPITQTLARLEVEGSASHPKIMSPLHLYGDERLNSRGVNLADGAELEVLRRDCEAAIHGMAWKATALNNGRPGAGVIARELFNPARPSERIGRVVEAKREDVGRAIESAANAFPAWESFAAQERAALLLRAASAFEEHRAEFLARLTLEAGRTLPDGVAEVREAIDFLRYYAAQARSHDGAGVPLQGPAGESNALRFRGKGVFACVSPWNFPLAIFTGQIDAALVTGNTVIAKPAEQSPLTAALAVEILHDVGIPPAVLQFLPGDGATLGNLLTQDPRVVGVAFTGSTDTARLIERNLASREGAIATFIAETGGINALIADSSALPEQLVLDVLGSAFNSAGQRCSAARVLLIQEEIAPRVLDLLTGAMDELQVGDPALLSTDIGPIIDREALEALESYAARLIPKARWYHRLKRPHAPDDSGYFCPPLAVEIPSLHFLEREVFGPILHIVRYRAADLDRVIEEINSLGYGLTLGIHTRIESRARRIAAKARVGNVYVNRNMIGAVVGTQPFGGMGRSGTGPKAGGPHYLTRFANEQTVTINTAALGGNAALLSLAED